MPAVTSVAQTVAQTAQQKVISMVAMKVKMMAVWKDLSLVDATADKTVEMMEAVTVVSLVLSWEDKLDLQSVVPMVGMRVCL